MTWIYILIALFALILMFYYSKNSLKQFNRWQKNNELEFLKNVKENWVEIKINTDDCIVINYDTQIDRNSANYSMTNEAENFFEWANKDSNRVDLVDVKRSKIVCEHKKGDKILAKYSKIVEIDKTVVEIKLRIKDYVSIYFPEKIDNENYFIDLEFLNQEIDFTKFNKK